MHVRRGFHILRELLYRRDGLYLSTVRSFRLSRHTWWTMCKFFSRVLLNIQVTVHSFPCMSNIISKYTFADIWGEQCMTKMYFSIISIKYHIRKCTCNYCPYACFPLVCESVWWIWRQNMLYMQRNGEHKIIRNARIILLFNILYIIRTDLITFLPDFSPHIAWFASKFTVLLHKLMVVIRIDIN
jgi:hypothetical protein